MGLHFVKQCPNEPLYHHLEVIAARLAQMLDKKQFMLITWWGMVMPNSTNLHKYGEMQFVLFQTSFNFA